MSGKFPPNKQRRATGPTCVVGVDVGAAEGEALELILGCRCQRKGRRESATRPSVWRPRTTLEPM